jgi:hypothetical protein
MKVSLYNWTNGNLVADSVTGISFGNVRQGQHTDTPVLIKPERSIEDAILEMKLYLQNNGGLSKTSFGHYTSDSYVSGIDHRNNITSHFELATGVTGLDYDEVTGVPITVRSGEPQDFVWLDAEVGSNETGATSSINYRFVFEFN